MKECAVYHWWADSSDAPPYACLRTPILLSIASLRAVSNIPIVVLDGSKSLGVKTDWDYFPEKLNFKVEDISFSLEKYNYWIKGWQHLSRFYDINNWSKTQDFQDFIYVDSDVFFLKSPLPLMQKTTKLCINGFNTGYFYFSHNQNWNEFMELFDAYTKASMFSLDVRELMKKYVNYESWYGVWDEMIITYMANKQSWLFNFINNEEHATLGTIDDATKIRMIHCNGIKMVHENPKLDVERSHARGLICLIFKEIYENIIKVLNENDMKKVFTPNELEMYIPKQLSLTSDIEKIKSYKNDQGHYDIRNVLDFPRMRIV